VNSNESEEETKGVIGPALAEWEPVIQDWLAQRRFDLVLDRFEEWDRSYSEWWTRFGSYLDKIPTSLIHERSRILLRTILPLYWSGKETEAFSLLQTVEERYAKLNDPSATIDAKICRANLYLISQRYDRAMAAHSELAKQPLNIEQRLNVCNALAILHSTYTRQLDEARRLFLETEELALDRGTTMTYLISFMNRAWHVELPQGRFNEAGFIAQKLIEARPSAKDSPFIRMCALLIRGAIEFERGSELTPITLEACCTLAVDLGYMDNALMAAELTACFYAERGMRTETDQWTARCETMTGVDLHKATALHWAKARCSACENDVAAMTRHLENARVTSIVFDVEVGTLLESARCWIEVGNVEKAADLAQEAIAKAEEHQMAWHACRARLVLCACEVKGVRDELSKLLQCSLLNEYDDLFTSRERILASRVLGHALALEIETDYARSLVAKLGKRIVQIRVFGGLQVSVGSRKVEEPSWVRPKARALFTCLCLHHRRPVPVDQVIEWFWPDSDFESVRNSLRVTLSYIRSALNQGDTTDRTAKYVNFEGEWISLDLGPGGWLDFEAFERMAKRALASRSDIDAIQQALELAEKPFLPEYALCEWAFEHQHALSSLRRELSLRLIDLFLQSERFTDAIVLSERLLSEDRCDETAFLLLHKALVACDRTADALRQIHRFTRAWRKHYEMEPSSTVLRIESELSRSESR
jgi:DNA-binding SARP family transcriptional activator